jgi:two-component system response regulator YesN
MYRVIIVEDSDWIRKGLEFTVPWQEYGFTVVGSASNGLEGLELVRKRSPDLVIADIKMPQMDGLEMIERLKEGGGRCPEFIVISGFNDFAFARKAILLGAKDYLLKPIDENDLAEVLRRIRESLSLGDSASRLERLLREQSFDPDFIAFFHRLMDASVRKDDLADYAMRRVEERFDTDISLGDIASELHVSESTLGKCFKRASGYSFVEYATMVRIKKALEFLAEPACRVGEVSSRVGIADARYFSSIFKRYTGFTPSQFRKIAIGGAIGDGEGDAAGDDSQEKDDQIRPERK